MSTAIIIGGGIFASAFTIGGLASFKNIRDARGPKERSYVVRVCALSWFVILSMLAFSYVLRPPWLYGVVGAYFLATPVLFYRWAHTHQLIRELERREGGSTRPVPKDAEMRHTHAA